MEILLSNSSDEPIYEQITSQIKAMIMKGSLKSGDTLPSMRKLAKELHVSVITAQRAYEELQRDGFIDTVAGKGTFVAAQNREFIREENLRIIEQNLEKTVKLARENDLALEELIKLVTLFMKSKITTRGGISMEFIIELDNVTKRYKDFTLDHISFRLPRGMIYGMIGENGAGKSTCIHAITDLISIDEGNIRLFGENYHQHAEEIKQKIGVVLDGVNQNPYLKCKDMDCIMKKIYKNWDSRKFFQYLKTFQISQEKKVKDLSKGMQVKLNFAVALSYNPELLILDEATSGLDPVMREDILELLQEFVLEENHSILISSHITSDLDKIADYILFLHEGKVLFVKSREEIEQYGILHCGQDFFEALSPEDYEAYIKNEFSYRLLVPNRYELKKHFSDLIINKASIEDVMLFQIKGVKSK